MPCNKINTTSGLQIFGKHYDVHNNVAYIMTKLLRFLQQKRYFKVILMSYDK